MSKQNSSLLGGKEAKINSLCICRMALYISPFYLVTSSSLVSIHIQIQNLVSLLSTCSHIHTQVLLSPIKVAIMIKYNRYWCTGKVVFFIFQTGIYNLLHSISFQKKLLKHWFDVRYDIRVSEPIVKESRQGLCLYRYYQKLKL